MNISRDATNYTLNFIICWLVQPWVVNNLSFSVLCDLPLYLGYSQSHKSTNCKIGCGNGSSP